MGKFSKVGNWLPVIGHAIDLFVFVGGRIKERRARRRETGKIPSLDEQKARETMERADRLIEEARKARK